MFFFTVFIPFIVIFTILLRRSSRKGESAQKAFWERELLANSTRRKDIENLPYIPFDISLIPAHRDLEDQRIDELLEELASLSGKRILNCTGKSNTDLKLEYGAPNITKLTEYDSNYTVLVRSLARLAEKYLLHASKSLQDISTSGGDSGSLTAISPEKAAALRSDAKKLLEYGISIGTDVRLNYELLAGIYKTGNDIAAIEGLKSVAVTLNSLSREPILRMLDRTLEDMSGAVS